jgi:ribosomal subunit interface protein
MKIIVSGKQVEVGEALSTHVENRLEAGVSKYLDRMQTIHVVISKESHQFKVAINGNTGTHAGLTIKSDAKHDDVYSAFDAAAEKIEKQLRRYKRRLKNHHKTTESHVERDKKAFRAKKYVLADIDESGAESQDDVPVVIAEKATDIEHLSVIQAVMKMDLADLPALMFINSSNGQINVVYRRKDGNISWVEQPSEVKAEVAA